MAGLGASGSAAVVNMPQAATQPQAPQNQGNFLTHLFPTIGGIGGGALGGAAGGALAGTAVLPGVGTAVGGLLGALLGGAAGGAGGKMLENNAEGQALGNGVGKEALVNGVLSAGPLRLLKGAGAIAKGATGGADGLLSALSNGGAAEAKIAAPSLLGNVQRAASDRSAGGYGVNVGSKLNGQVLTPETSANLTDFITKGATKYGGIRAGMPLQQADDALAVHNNVIASLGSKLDQINRPITAEDTQGIAQAMRSAAMDNPALAGSNLSPLSTLAGQVSGATDLKSLEAARMAADKLAYPNGTDLASSQLAQQGSHARDAIDQYVSKIPAGATPEEAQAINEYKAIKGDYGNSKNLLNTISEASNNAKGIHVPLLGGQVGEQTLTGARNKVNSLMAGNTGTAADMTGLSAIGGLKGVATRDIAGNPTDLVSALSSAAGGQGTMNDNKNSTSTASSTNSNIGSLNDALQQNANQQAGLDQQSAQNPFSQANIQQAIEKDVAANGGKNVAKLQSLYTTFGKTKDDLTTNQKNEVVSQQRALGSLSAYVNNLGQAGGAEGPLKGAIDGSIAGNYTNPQAKAIDAQRIDVASAIAGSLNPRGTVSPVTARIISDALPSIHDSPTVARSKITNLLAQIKSGAYSGETPVSQLIKNSQAQ